MAESDHRNRADMGAIDRGGAVRVWWIHSISLCLPAAAVIERDQGGHAL
jgi:hypothetical protein